MKKTKISIPFILQLLIVAGMFAAGFMLYEQLPAEVPSHWNAAGEVDDYMDKTWFTVLLPSVALLMTLLFPIFKNIDPLKKNYSKFSKAWNVLRVSLIAFMAYLYFVTMYIAFNPGISAGPFVFAGMGLLFIALGYCIGEVKRNYFVGIRTPWTLHNDKVWDKTHTLGRFTFMAAGLVLFVNAFIMWQTIPVMIGAILLGVIAPTVYSYLLHRNL